MIDSTHHIYHIIGYILKLQSKNAQMQFYLGNIMAYQQKNGCSRRPSKQQILLIIIYLIILCLHSIFIVSAIIALQSPTLYVLLFLYYITLLFAFYYYIRITVDDPTDRLIKDPAAIQQIDKIRITQCFTCGKVQLGSYHCRRCNRCAEEFDHHCKFVNNCIGKSNYHDFIKLLCFGVINFILILIQNLWAYIEAKNSGEISTSIENNLWVVIIMTIICGIVTILVVILLIFHCYVLYVDITTLQYVRKTDNKQKSKIKQFRNSILEYEEELQEDMDKYKKQVLTQRQLKEYPEKQLHNPENIIDDRP